VFWEIILIKKGKRVERDLSLTINFDRETFNQGKYDDETILCKDGKSDIKMNNADDSFIRIQPSARADQNNSSPLEIQTTK